MIHTSYFEFSILDFGLSDRIHREVTKPTKFGKSIFLTFVFFVSFVVKYCIRVYAQ